jgi:hypothetical protein
MKIDLKRLRTDVKQLKARRTDSPLGKTKTGATEAIRAHFDELELMHRDGSSWNEIAAGLASQGVTQGKGQPLTGRRLTALMHNIRARARKLKGQGPQLGKSKADAPQRRPSGSTNTLVLSPEMTSRRDDPQPEHPISEEEIRRSELVKHAHLLRRR